MGKTTIGDLVNNSLAMASNLDLTEYDPFELLIYASRVVLIRSCLHEIIVVGEIMGGPRQQNNSQMFKEGS